MEVTKLSRVMRANRLLETFIAEAKRDIEFQQRMSERLAKFVVDNRSEFEREFNKVVKSSKYEQR